MLHIHLPSCDSTQSYLIENMNSSCGESILVSASKQSKGVGRTGNTWDHLNNGLAFSFNHTPNSTPTLTPLEIGVQLVLFLEQNFGVALKLKWPNDLLTEEGKKCGGIITTMLDDKTVVVGIGLNLGQIDQRGSCYKTPIDSIIHTEIDEKQKKLIPAKIYQYIIGNRVPATGVLELWPTMCHHLNKNVRMVSGNKTATGKFIGIGKNGEAAIQEDGNITHMYSGSLWFD
ncbi:MAG: biotin--[acetyl-CoA-carboxylase] ligase [Bacteriovoracaceae bacterium]|nr:biotin--[acetyl-CoA-carboxylase] ligase [Bacteriovoracaceae bacterium]